MPTLVLLAAGMGSRYGGLKQLDAFGPAGETLMDYAVRDALKAGFDRVVFVIRHDFEAQFREQVLTRYDGRIECALAFQGLEDLPAGRRPPEGRAKPWGTGQAVLAARNIVWEPFAACNADDYYGPEAYAAMAAWLRRPPEAGEAALVGYRLADTLSPHGTVSRGVCEVRDGWLKRVVERKAIAREGQAVLAKEGGQALALDEAALVSMNFWGFHPGFFASLQEAFAVFLGGLKDPLKDEFLLPEVVNAMLDQGTLKAKALPGGEHWFGVTYPEDKEGVRAELKALSKGRF